MTWADSPITKPQFSPNGRQADEEGRKADLRLDIEEYAKDEDMMAIVAGEPEESEIFFRIHSDDEDELMPPPEIGKPLSEKEKDILEQWIAEGARKAIQVTVQMHQHQQHH